jgi:hypothetical protein
MLHTNFSKNFNHNLCNLCFSDIRVDTSLELYQDREIQVNGHSYGIAKVVALRNFPMSHLSDELSFIVCGHNAGYLKVVLQKMYGPLQDYSLISWVVFEWKHPNLNKWSNLYLDAWHKNVERFATSYRDTPEGQSLQFALDL